MRFLASKSLKGVRLPTNAPSKAGSTLGLLKGPKTALSAPRRPSSGPAIQTAAVVAVPPPAVEEAEQQLVSDSSSIDRPSLTVSDKSAQEALDSAASVAQAEKESQEAKGILWTRYFL